MPKKRVRTEHAPAKRVCVDSTAIGDIPDDVLELVFERLSDISAVRLVSRRWAQVASMFVRKLSFPPVTSSQILCQQLKAAQSNFMHVKSLSISELNENVLVALQPISSVIALRVVNIANSTSFRDRLRSSPGLRLEHITKLEAAGTAPMEAYFTFPVWILPAFPALRSLRISSHMRQVGGDLCDALAVSCRDLRALHIDTKYRMPAASFLKMIRACPHLEEIINNADSRVPFSALTDIAACLPNLKTFVMRFSRKTVPLTRSQMGKAFLQQLPHLERLSVGQMDGLGGLALAGATHNKLRIADGYSPATCSSCLRASQHRAGGLHLLHDRGPDRGRVAEATDVACENHPATGRGVDAAAASLNGSQ